MMSCRFMRAWKRQNPKAYCILHYDKLYIDNRLYVWDKESQEVTSSSTFSSSSSLVQVVEGEGDADSRKTSSSSRPPSSLLRWRNQSIYLQLHEISGIKTRIKGGVICTKKKGGTKEAKAL